MNIFIGIVVLIVGLIIMILPLELGTKVAETGSPDWGVYVLVATTGFALVFSGLIIAFP